MNMEILATIVAISAAAVIITIIAAVYLIHKKLNQNKPGLKLLNRTGEFTENLINKQDTLIKTTAGSISNTVTSTANTTATALTNTVTTTTNTLTNTVTSAVQNVAHMSVNATNNIGSALSDTIKKQGESLHAALNPEELSDKITKTSQLVAKKSIDAASDFTINLTNKVGDKLNRSLSKTTAQLRERNERLRAQNQAKPSDKKKPD